MNIIRLNTRSCQSCYKCIRECPLKAIEFRDNTAQVIEEECVLCGRCVQSCPQNARILRDDFAEVQGLIASGKPVYLSLAPSWVAWWKGRSFSAVSRALKALGFAGVEETAIGAAAVSREYAAIMRGRQMDSIIATACPSVVMLIERHYPSLIKYLAPVASPMMAHARLMREAYGDIKVVFVGPCLAKMAEASDPLAGGMVNYSLTFDSVDRWLEKQGVSFGEEDGEARGVREPVARLYPEPTGILKTLSPEDTDGYTPIAVDGVESCIDLFHSLQKEPAPGLFIEANLCAGGCMGGPVMRMHGLSGALGEMYLSSRPDKADATPAESTARSCTHPRVFQKRGASQMEPTEEEIRGVLQKIGKFTPEDELNCSSCGYPTCRDKAIAVLRGKADISMCMPYLMARAENISSTVLEYSPNAILAFDEDFNVIDLNPRAEELFDTKHEQAVGMPLPAFFGDTSFDEARDSGRIVERKSVIAETGRTAEQAVVYIRKHRMYLVFVKDVTEEEARQKELVEVRSHTAETAQRVIDKQMRVAQEIASLLGETTAETKVALNRLRSSLTGRE